jgi:hypothetical protein
MRARDARRLADVRVSGEMRARNCYVGYVDLLGFSSLVRSDFERAQADYVEILLGLSLIDRTGKLKIFPRHVEITAASDSFLIVSDELHHVANWCSSVQIAAIRTGRLARGGIAYGRHIQRNVHSEGSSRHHLLVVSEAVVNAVDEERKESRPPCGVTLHASVSTQAIEALDGKLQLAKQRSIVFKDGCWIANPFGADVLHWVEPKLREMRDDPSNAKHVGKYEWLLDLFNAVKANTELRP